MYIFKAEGSEIMRHIGGIAVLNKDGDFVAIDDSNILYIDENMAIFKVDRKLSKLLKKQNRLKKNSKYLKKYVDIANLK